MSGRFTPRPTQHTGVTKIGGWQLKRYEITLDATPIGAAINAAIDRLISDAVPPPADDSEVGFVVIHRGTEQLWVLADMWHGDILHQHTFVSDLDYPTAFRPVPTGGPIACVWELAVHTHERNSYITHILDPIDGPHRDAYLSDSLAQPRQGRRQVLESFNDAWTCGDVDGLMELMSDDPAYRASTGAGPGIEYRGREAVRRGFTDVLAAESSCSQPAPATGDIHLTDEHGISSWTYRTIGPDGSPSVVEGIDVWTFDGDRIAVKDAYRKAFPDPEPTP